MSDAGPETLRLQELLLAVEQADTVDSRAAATAVVTERYGARRSVLVGDLEGFTARVLRFGIVPFIAAIYRMRRLCTPLVAQGAGYLFKADLPGVKETGCRLAMEPGRVIAGNAGILVSRVLYTKQSGEKRFLIQDAAMNDLIRPTLYEAYHEIRAVEITAANAPRIKADVVGPVCETGDYLALDREMAMPKPGDLLAISSGGAYGAVQAGTYNSRLLVPEVLVKGADFHVIRPRKTYEELIGLDSIPAWLSA